jgi:hypothetical protein
MLFALHYTLYNLCSLSSAGLSVTKFMLADFSPLELVGLVSLFAVVCKFFNRYVVNILASFLRPLPPKVTVPTVSKEETGKYD